MRFGVTIPNNWGIADPRQVLAMGPLAEALGYDSVWVMDWAGTLDRLAQLDFTHIARSFLSNVGPVLATQEARGAPWSGWPRSRRGSIRVSPWAR
jgi:hypothetical protein